MNVWSSSRVTRVPVRVAAVLILLTGFLAIPAQASGSSQAAAAQHNGMTWVVRAQRAGGVVNVGADAQTDAYAGDTSATSSLPLLCLTVDNSPVPDGVVPDFYNGWARGWVALTPAVPGVTLTSRDVADSACAAYFGAGWRMAEHHDGWYGEPPSRGGWHFWARGVVPSGIRFWAAIDDQPANPWD